MGRHAKSSRRRILRNRLTTICACSAHPKTRHHALVRHRALERARLTRQSLPATTTTGLARLLPPRRPVPQCPRYQRGAPSRQARPCARLRTVSAAAHGADDPKAPCHHMGTALNRGAEEEPIAERRTVTVRCDDRHADLRVISDVIALVLRQLELTRPFASCGNRDLPPGQRRLDAHQLRLRPYPAEHAAPLPEQGGSRLMASPSKRSRESVP